MSDPLVVLLVEDNPGDADLIEEALLESGPGSFTVENVVRLTDALARLKRGPVDVALVDLGLPDSAGVDTVRALRRAAPEMPIVVMTGTDDESTGIAALQEGAQDYLVKGQIPGNLLPRILRYSVERQSIETRLRESEHFLRSTLDALQPNIAILDETGRILAVNRAWRDFARNNDADADAVCEGSDYLGVCRMAAEQGDKNASAFAAGIHAVMEKKVSSFDLEYPCHSPTEQRWFHGRATLFPGAGPLRIVVAHDNITERKNMEQQLFQAQKMESIGTLAGGIAHDFNNILSSIIVNAELTLMDIPEGTSLHNRTQDMYKSAFRAAALVKQILTFSRQDKQEPTVVQLAPIVKESMAFLRATMPASVHINQSITTEDDTIFADPVQIQQVVMNLCTNAAYAMRETGGTLDVRVYDVVDKEELRSISLLDPKCRYLGVHISDTGIGIDSHDLHRIFEPYFSTKPLSQGTGLGLAVVHGIVHKHQGAIRVESERGKGTTCKVYFPVCTGSVEAPQTDTEPLRGNERILLIDDEEMVVTSCATMLKSLGYRITARLSSIEALELFKAQPDRFDLVITDQAMPNVTGDVLARKILFIRPDIPIILCTGFSDIVDEEKVNALGIRGFLLKPFVRSQVAEKIRSVLDGQGS